MELIKALAIALLLLGAGSVTYTFAEDESVEQDTMEESNKEADTAASDDSDENEGDEEDASEESDESDEEDDSEESED